MINSLKINSSKTQLIIFKSAGRKLEPNLIINIDGCVLSLSISVKLLGVTLDRHFTFGLHIDAVVKKAHGIIGLLAKASLNLLRELLRMAYIGLVRSRLEYASAVFASASITQLKKLDTIQRIAARLICHLHRDAHSAPLLLSLPLSSLSSRREVHIYT